jgi:hypothetical protein
VSFRWLPQFALCLAIFSAAAPVFGQDSSKDQIIQKLLDRVDALEREVAALQTAQVQPAPAVSQAAPQPVVENTPVSNVDTGATADNTSRFTFHGYADAGFTRNVDGTSAKDFQLGEVDLFATERLSSHLTALMEVALETDSQTLVADVPVNVERLLLQYRGNDFFNADIGSYRTAIGYYSTAYLRGSWLQTAISRPKMFTFEDQGGALPLHAVGVSINGRIPSGELNLHYVFEAGSSRNYGDTAGLAFDSSFNRATNAAIYSQPHAIPGMEIGFSSYHDLFSPVAGFAVHRSVWMVHFVYVRGRVEFLNEGLLVGLKDQSLGSDTNPGFYSKIAYRVASSWKPYARVEYANVYGTGLLSTANARVYVPWKTVYTGGVRYDLTESVALKVELGRETDYLRPSFISTAIQLAFTF